MWKMMRRIRKELCAGKNYLIMGCVLIFLTQLALAVLQLSAHRYTSCILDAFAWISYNMPSTIYMIAMLITTGMTKSISQADRIVRNKSFHSMWVYYFFKTGMISGILAVFHLVSTFFIGWITSGSFCNWSQTDSYCYYAIGTTLEYVNIPMILLTYFLSSFLGFFASALIPVLSWWLCGSYAYGIAVSAFLNLFGDYRKFDYVWFRGVFYHNIAGGIQIKQQFLYPMLVLIAIYVLGGLRRKRDFLEKGALQER